MIIPKIPIVILLFFICQSVKIMWLVIIFDELRMMSRLLEEQGKDPMLAYAMLIAHGHKVLYKKSLTVDKTGKEADIVAFPCSEKELLQGKTEASVRYGPRRG